MQVGFGRAGPAIVDWVFAYGSLLPAGHTALPEGAIAADLHGWRRSRSVAMDNSVELPNYKHYVAPDGHRPDLMVCYLDIDERSDSVVPRARAGRLRRPAPAAALEALTEPADLPVAELSLVRHAPVAVPRSVR